MPAPVRRLSTSNAKARGAATPPPTPAPRRSAIREEVGRGFVGTSTTRLKEVYDETQREVEVVRTQFGENEHPTYVKVGGGLTINLGDFSSLRIDCSVTFPCRIEDLEAAYEKATDFVADKIAEEQTRWLGTGSTKAPR